METFVVSGVDELRRRTRELVDHYYLDRNKDESAQINIPEAYRKEFFALIDQIVLKLLEDRDNFYGYFLFQMSREIRFDINSPTAVNFRSAKYVIYFNPVMFMELSSNQMETTIKHEILHVVSVHLLRAKDLRGSYSTLAINMAMDIVVNKYLTYLPPYATTLEWVNLKFGLKLEPYQAFEYYVEELQRAIDLQEAEATSEDDSGKKKETELKETEQAESDHIEIFEHTDTNDNEIETEYSIEKTHELWTESDELEGRTLQEFTEKIIRNAEKGGIPSYLAELIANIKSRGEELPWSIYLNRLMGTIESNKKKTITRRNRRQPERLELRGELRSHKAKIIVALDISGSISDEEFKQAIREVLDIVRNYNHEITILECDDEIRRVYQVKSEKDIQARGPRRGGTRYSPVFEYANRQKQNLLVYFTDGKGEERLKVTPRGYKVLWVISGRGESLSLKEPYGVVKRLKHIDPVDNGPDLSEVVRSGYSMQHQESI